MLDVITEIGNLSFLIISGIFDLILNICKLIWVFYLYLINKIVILFFYSIVFMSFYIL